MKIFIDIGHPAHVHYFRNFIKLMMAKGHQFFISSREKECTAELLESYGLPFYSRGKGRNGIVGKLMYMLKADRMLYRKAKQFKPDVFLSFVSPYAAQVAWFMKKPHITFDDTEHANLARKFYQPFTKTIFTPYCFKKELGSQQVRFNGFMELCYLHPTYFKPDPSIYSILNLAPGEEFVLLRFVSFKANHDIGQSGLDLETKKKIIERLKGKYRIFISSEGKMPEEMLPYKINIPANRMHDVLAFATLFIGEGATMASECAMMGTPAIYVNTLDAGTLQEQEKLGLIYGFRNSSGVLQKIEELLSLPNLKIEFGKRSADMRKKMVDPTAMLINYFGKLNQ
ncbi:MAG: hypothetical protein JWO32_1148 [Bacteroidetes bacterium]|nr:hypothetical protein [Bacteroidota bacterium]